LYGRIPRAIAGSADQRGIQAGRTPSEAVSGGASWTSASAAWAREGLDVSAWVNPT
jgi:hypothetical protein